MEASLSANFTDGMGHTNSTDRPQIADFASAKFQGHGINR
jgi:hypothetical protein